MIDQVKKLCSLLRELIDYHLRTYMYEICDAN